MFKADDLVVSFHLSINIIDKGIIEYEFRLYKSYT